MKLNSLLTRKAAMIASLAICTASQALAIDEVDPAPQSLGSIGITPSETARFSAVLLLPAVQSAAPGPCVVEMRFIDSFSRTLAVLQKVQLRPNEVVWLDLPGTQAYMLQPLRAGRVQIRAEIKSINEGGVCTVAQTLELFDTASGKTSVVMQPSR